MDTLQKLTDIQALLEYVKARLECMPQQEAGNSSLENLVGTIGQENREEAERLEELLCEYEKSVHSFSEDMVSGINKIREELKNNRTFWDNQAEKLKETCDENARDIGVAMDREAARYEQCIKGLDKLHGTVEKLTETAGGQNAKDLGAAVEKLGKQMEALMEQHEKQKIVYGQYVTEFETSMKAAEAARKSLEETAAHVEQAFTGTARRLEAMLSAQKEEPVVQEKKGRRWRK